MRKAPNIRVNRSAQQRVRCWVPAALRAPAPGYAGRSAAQENAIQKLSGSLADADPRRVLQAVSLRCRGDGHFARQ